MKLINTKNSTVVILVNVLVNGLTGFYIFSQAFCDKNFGFISFFLTLLCVGTVLGTFSGALLKTCRSWQVLVSICPLFPWFLLFLAGAVEKGGVVAVIIALFNFTLPLLLEGGAWWLAAAVSRRRQ